MDNMDTMGTMGTMDNMGTMGTMDNMDTMVTDVANMEDSYVGEGYDDYGGYEGQSFEAGDGHGYADQDYRGDGGAGQQGFSSHVLRTGSGFTCAERGKEFTDQSHARRH